MDEVMLVAWLSAGKYLDRVRLRPIIAAFDPLVE